MNRVVAYELLTSELAAYYKPSIGEPGRSSRIVRGADGIDYELQMEAAWQSGTQENIRLTITIGEANWGAPHDSISETVIIPIAALPTSSAPAPNPANP